MNKNYDEFINQWKNIECSFLKMECAFAEKTEDEVLNNIDVKELLDNGSTSFQIEDEDNVDNYINVDFDVIKFNKDEPLESIIKITNIDYI